MTKDAVVQLFDYHYWARDRMLAALEPLSDEQYRRDVGNSFKSIHETAVHIYSAEWVWHSRWKGVSPDEMVDAASLPDVPALAQAWHELESRLRHTLDGLIERDMTREVDYRLMSGAAGRSVFWHMAQQVVNHASYHRGQVTTMLRQMGAAPPAGMDLITFYREQSRPEV